MKSLFKRSSGNIETEIKVRSIIACPEVWGGPVDGDGFILTYTEGCSNKLLTNIFSYILAVQARTEKIKGFFQVPCSRRFEKST